VTHDQVEAMTMGHRVAVLQGGRLQQCASPRQLYDNPVNQFVAGFIGSPAMNLRTVQLADGAARLANRLIPLPPAIRTAAGEAGLSELVIGIRPEHLHLTSGSGELAGPDHPHVTDGSGELTGEVILVEELGADALLHVRLPEGGTQLVARSEGRKPPTPGQEVTLAVQRDDIFAFHPVTGARLAG
jgi:multiple sugar transport system ATP-binding protein